MSIRPAKFCDHPDCDNMEAADSESHRYAFLKCELCGGDFCTTHYTTLVLASTAFGAQLHLKIQLCDGCTKFANGAVFNKRIPDTIERSLTTTSDLVKEHLKAEWATHALQQKESAT